VTAAPAQYSPGYHPVRSKWLTRAKWGALDAVPETITPATTDLLAFTQATFPRYQPAPHHRLIADALMQVERGEIDRLIITMPPRHGKTELASIRFPAWYLGRNPDKRIIAASYAAGLAYRISRQARNVVTGQGWPFTQRLADDLAQVQQWDLAAHRGGYIAAGAGGPITGSGAHLLLIDDPIKNQEEADSATHRDNLWEWYTSTAYTRLEDNGAICVIQTRWHADDLAGRLLAAQAQGGDRWTVLHLPALADVGDPLGREPGAALWPEKYDTAALARIKQAVGSRVFAALYQGQPSNDESALLKREWWTFYQTPPAQFDQVIQSWDMTFKGGVNNDYVVGQVWGKVGADCYLLDQVRGRLDFPATLEAVRTLSRAWPQATTKLIEDTANGPAVIATLTREIGGIVPVRPEGGKVARVNAVAGLIEAGNVHLPDPQFRAWVGELIEEATAFPTGAHDDQCFVAGTMIATPRGDRPIEQVKVGDKVITPMGLRRVSAAGCTGARPVIQRRGLTGTANHPVFTHDRGFVPLAALNNTSACDILSIGGLIQWIDRKQSNSTVPCTALGAASGTTTLASRHRTPDAKARKACTSRSGNTTTGARFRLGMMSTIAMKIRLTTILATWSVYRIVNTCNAMRMRGARIVNSLISRKSNPLRSHGTKVLRGRRGIASMARHLGRGVSLARLFVSSVVRNSWRIAPRSIVLRGVVNAMPLLTWHELPSDDSALSAVLTSTRLSPVSVPALPKPADDRVAGNSLGPEPVYNLTIEDTPVYYANGVLVHNCDAMSQALVRLNVAPEPSRQLRRSGGNRLIPRGGY